MSDRILPFAFYRDKISTETISCELSWLEVVEIALHHAASPCTRADGPNKCIGAECKYKAFPFEDDDPVAWLAVRIEGSRLAKNVKSVSLLFLDFDKISREQAIKVFTKLKSYEHVVHSTHNHNDVEISFRVIVLTTRDVEAGAWHRFLPAAVEYLDVTVETIDKKGKTVRQPDRTCKDLARLYFRPTHPKDADYSNYHNVGKALDVDEVLAWADANPEKAKAPAVQTVPTIPSGTGSSALPTGLPFDLDGDNVISAIEVASKNFPDSRRHELCMAYAGMLRKAGATEEDARHIVFEIAKDGGSNNPNARAGTVSHTYALDADAALTGYTRACEIVGESVASMVGDYFTDAYNEAFLKRHREKAAVKGTTAGRDAALAPFASVEISTPSNGTNGTHAAPALPAGTVVYEATGTPHVPGASLPAVDFAPAAASLPSVVPVAALASLAPIDLKELRGKVSALASKRSRSLERDDKIAGLLLRRVLGGKPLAVPGGVGDIETVKEGEEHGVDIESALRSVLGALAFVLPAETPWQAVFEILRDSIVTLEPDADGPWTDRAKKMYERSQTTRLRMDIEKQTTENTRLSHLDATAFKTDDKPNPPKDPKWLDNLEKKPDGGVATTFANARSFLQNDPKLCGFLRWNKVTKLVDVTGGIAAAHAEFGIDSIVAGIQDYLISQHRMMIPFRDLQRRVIDVARENAYDPLKDYLNDLQWNGTERIGNDKTNWLTKYCGAADTPYTRKVARRWMIALVARGLNPGCKVDNVLVLEAPPGVGKSTVFSILGGKWFCDTAIVLGDKDSRMLAGQYWICELAEIVAFKKTGHEVLKNFISSSTDKFRLPYGATLEESPRRCVWVGTTNEEQYLGDETGNRKYWPVACAYTKDGTDALIADRDQLLAEAVAAYRSGEKWHFSYEEIPETEEETEDRMAETPMREKVISWWYSLRKVERPTVFTTMDVAESALNAQPMQVKSGDLMAIGHTLAKMKAPSGALGFVRRRDRNGPSRSWRYYATEEMLNVETRGQSRTLSMVPMTPAMQVPPGLRAAAERAAAMKSGMEVS